jgi:hypothetical protein
MVQFQVSQTHSVTSHQDVRFALAPGAVLAAGSRHGRVPAQVCSHLVDSFCSRAVGFLVGCASGVDNSFRLALSRSEYVDFAFVACAFPNRIKKSYDLFASVVVPPGLSPAASLARRTLWMVKRCSMLLLFPDDPYTGTWGRGSTLAFNTCISQLKPAFVVTKIPPKKHPLYNLFPASLFGVVSGFWAVPHTIKDGGTCDDC